MGQGLRAVQNRWRDLGQMEPTPAVMWKVWERELEGGIQLHEVSGGEKNTGLLEITLTL